MNLFHLVDKDGKKRLEPRSPLRYKKKEIKRNRKSFAPDFCDTSDLSTDTDEFSEELSVEAKLRRAKGRREEASKKLELVLNHKNEQAFQRAQKWIASKKEKIRNKNRKVKRINERHSYMEKRRRKRAMNSIENRLNSALTRAEENLTKRKQGRASYSKRIERAQNKRALIEFETRSALLATVGHRSERAARNYQLRLEDLQGKARHEIQHAHLVAKRVKASRVLQKAIRAKFGFNDQSDKEQLSLSVEDAALRLQNCLLWKAKVVASRLSSGNDIESFKNILVTMGLSTTKESILGTSFEQLTSVIMNATSLASTKSLLEAFEPLLNSINLQKRETISVRALLSVFLVAFQPDEVLGEKRGNDKCSNLLEKSAERLVSVLLELAELRFDSALSSENHRIIQEVGSRILSYCTLFDKWKNADFDELIDKMTKSAHQSWVVFLTSKQAIQYIEGKSSSADFQHLLKYRSSQRGAGSHIKRVRAAMKKILGEEQSFIVMRGAKQAAMAHIEKEQLMVSIKNKIDHALDALSYDSTHEDDSSIATDTKPQPKQKMDIPDSILSNAQLVHQLLLMDEEDVDDLLKRGSENFTHLSSAEIFMTHYRNHSAAPAWVEGSSSMDGIKQLMLDLINKMRKLVPNRQDLQQYFTEDQVNACKSTNDYFTMTLNMADVLGNSLESLHRSEATLEWYTVTNAWHSQKYDSGSIPYGFSCWRSFLIASLAFIIGKADLCQMEIVNFQLVQIAPVVRANGRDYEMQRFQEKYGEFSSMKSTDTFKATWKWIERINRSPSRKDISVRLQEGFVDEIFFTKEAIEIPEVLNLDLSQIHNIRSLARVAVISASLILHSCKVTNTRISDMNCDSLSSEAKYYKDNMITLLNGHLPYDAMLKGVSEAVIMFSQTISGQPLDEVKVKTLEIVIDSVLKGRDPVFSLLDNRMRSVFKCACKFTMKNKKTKPQPPLSMKTGLKGDLHPTQKKVNDLKAQFMITIGKEVRKLGFNIIEDALVQATYEAFKVISHCIGLYRDELLSPMFHHLTAEENS